MKTSYFQRVLAACAFAGALTVAQAQPPRNDHNDRPEHAEHAERAAPHVEQRHVSELPRGRVDVRVGNDHYYEHRGTFYHPGPHGYVVVRPPRGARIPHLPPRAARIYFGGGLFYRYDDIYYQQVGDEYVVVDAPVGVTTVVPDSSGVVTAAPNVVAPAPTVAAPAPGGDYQSIFVGSTQYFFRDGQFFERTADGMVWTPAPVGAITPSLPTDATSVWYQDIEYFDSDGVYFRKTPDGYKVVTAPWVKS